MNQRGSRTHREPHSNRSIAHRWLRKTGHVHDLRVLLRSVSSQGDSPRSQSLRGHHLGRSIQTGSSLVSCRRIAQESHVPDDHWAPNQEGEIFAEVTLHFRGERRARAPLPAGAGVALGVEVWKMERHENRTAGRGCTMRLDRPLLRDGFSVASIRRMGGIG
jgi:hypothetical protein